MLLESLDGDPLFSLSFFNLLRLGDGDREEEIHDFRAKLASDPETDALLLSRLAAEIWGTGGASLGVVRMGSRRVCLSGELFTLCIQDFGRATKDFLLPILSSFCISSFGSGAWLFISSFGLISSSLMVSGGASSDNALGAPFTALSWPSSVGREVKLADRGNCSSGFAWENWKSKVMRSGILGEECERGKEAFSLKAVDMVNVGPCMTDSYRPAVSRYLSKHDSFLQ